MKLCVDCKWYRDVFKCREIRNSRIKHISYHFGCVHPECGSVNPSNGAPLVLAKYIREHGSCKIEGKFWEPIPPPPPSVWILFWRRVTGLFIRSGTCNTLNGLEGQNKWKK